VNCAVFHGCARWDLNPCSEGLEDRIFACGWMRNAGFEPVCIEGCESSSWAIVLGVGLEPRTRLYELSGLWCFGCLCIVSWTYDCVRIVVALACVHWTRQSLQQPLINTITLVQYIYIYIYIYILKKIRKAKTSVLVRAWARPSQGQGV